METPFHTSRNVCHQARSERNTALSQTNGWRIDFVPLSKSNMRLRNVLRGHTTLPACQLARGAIPPHWDKRARSFSWGRRRHICTESSSMPKKDRQVVGPSWDIELGEDPQHTLEVDFAPVRVWIAKSHPGSAAPFQHLSVEWPTLRHLRGQ